MNTSGARTVLLTGMLLTLSAQAATFQWRNTSGDGNWNNALNWLPNTGVPGPADTAAFNSVGGTVTISGVAASVAALTKSNATAVIIAGPQSLTIGAGGITRTGGGGGNMLTISANVVIGTAGETWTFPGVNNTISGTITGQSFTKAGGGTLNLRGNNNFAGLTVGAGTLTTTGNDTITSVTVNAGTVSMSGTENLASLTVNGGAVTLNGNDSLTAVAVSGGTLNLGGSNSLGAATVNGGTLQANAANALGVAVVTLTGGTVTVNGATALVVPASVVGQCAGTPCNLRAQGGGAHSIAAVTTTSVTTALTLTSDAASTLSVTNLTVNAGTTLSGAAAGNLAAVTNLTLNGTMNGGGAALPVSGTLQGSGTMARAVNVAAGGTLQPGTPLATGAMTLNDTTNINLTVGTTTTSTAVTGALTVDGIINVTPGPGFGSGSVAIFTATGAIANNFLQFPNPPAGFNLGYHIASGTVFLDIAVRPLVAKAGRMDVTHDGRSTQITWSEGSDLQTLGYRVWRQEGARRVPVGPAFIEGAALRASASLKNDPSTAIEDWKAPGGGTYWVEAIRSRGGSQWFGPTTSRASTDGGARSIASLVATRANATPDLRGGRGNRPRIELDPDDGAVAPTPQSQWALASRAAAKVDVREAGVYRVPAQALIDAGIPRGSSVSTLQVWNEGRQVAFRTIAADGAHLNPGDAIEFYGQALDRRYTDVRVYWVTAGLGTATLFSTSSDGAVSSGGPSFPETLTFQERLYRFGSLKNGGNEKYFGPLIYDTPDARVYSTPELDLTSNQSAVLELAVQGATQGSHVIEVSLNGMLLGTLRGSDQQLMTKKISIPPGLLGAGDNIVQLRAPGSGDLSFEVYQRLTYPRLYRSTGDALYLRATGGDYVQLDGAPAASTRVLDITQPTAPIAVSVGSGATDGSVSVFAVPGRGRRQLFAFSEADVKAPLAVRPNAPTSWHASAGADLVVIAHGSLMGSVQPLVDQRRAEGLQVALVDVEDVYDEFGAGEKDVAALRAFLTYAWQNWNQPPQYVLLVGSATYNPRNYPNGTGAGVDQVPTVLVETAQMETGSDDGLVTVGRGAAMAVGRLPMSSPDDITRTVGKILGRAPLTASSSLLFVRDEDDGVSAFSQATASVRSGLSQWPSQELARDGTNDSMLHGELVAALNSAPAAVNYLGHGEEGYWTGHILSVADAPALANGSGASTLFAGTCLNGYFVDPLATNLATILLSVGGGGSWAVWASSGMTNPGAESGFATRLWKGALVEGLTLGDATVRAKNTVQDPDFRATFHLFGDPSARMTSRQK